MAGKIFGVLCLISVVSAILLGNTAALSAAVFEGAETAVKLTLSLLGSMALWSGVMRVFASAGAINKLSSLISPLLRFLFPRAAANGRGIDEISANIGANMLGIGNAATPSALNAMKILSERAEEPGTATDEMIMLAVMNTVPFTLLPATLITLREAAESPQPALILPAVWVSSAGSALFAALFVKLYASIRRNKINIKQMRRNDALPKR